MSARDIVFDFENAIVSKNFDFCYSEKDNAFWTYNNKNMRMSRTLHSDSPMNPSEIVFRDIVSSDELNDYVMIKSMEDLKPYIIKHELLT